MLPGRVSNPGPLTYESDALPIALRGPASSICITDIKHARHKTWIYSLTVALVTDLDFRWQLLGNRCMKTHILQTWPISDSRLTEFKYQRQNK